MFKFLQVEFSIDDNILSDIPTLQHGINIAQVTTGHYYIEIKNLNVRVDLKLHNSEFIVSVPYTLYGKNLQGLCGVLKNNIN